MSTRRHYSEQEFEGLVSSALDELPVEFQRALEHVAIVVSDRGSENHAYGMYVAGSVFYSACLQYEGGKFGEALGRFQDTEPLK